ncbi:unnamed protein product, partial [Rotaria sp. Silwood1]
NIQSSINLCPSSSSDSICVLDNNNNSPSNIEELFQSSFPSISDCKFDFEKTSDQCCKKPLASDTTPIEQQQQVRESSSTFILPDDARISHNQHEIRFETEPMEKFRARYLSQYVPKKKYKRDGKTESKQSSPTYFSDRHKTHYLTLLMSKILVFGSDPIDLCRIKVEVCIVTLTIDGCIYIHPYFTFYKPEGNKNYSLSNPIYIHLGNDEDYKNPPIINEILNAKLYLAVINLLDNELLKKPIQPFESLKSNGIADTATYTNYDEYKNKFCLNKLRFAVTLWIKSLHGEPRHSDKPHNTHPPSVNAIRSIVSDRSQQDQIPVVNQYTVHVNVFKCDKWYNANKRQHNLFETIQKTFSNKKLIIHQYVCFDDGNFLYSRELLLNKVKTYEIIIKNELYQLDIKDMSDHVTVADMWQFVRSKTPYKRSQDLIRMFETLLKQTIRSYIVCIRNQFFEKNQTLYDDGSFQNSGFAFLQVIYNIQGFGDNGNCHPVILYGTDGDSCQISVIEFLADKYKIK